MRYQIRNAKVQFGADTILNSVNFEIHDTEKIAIVGRNGCGKTTLLRLIAGDIEMSNLDSDESCGITMSGKQNIGFLRQINFTDGDVPVKEELEKAFSEVFACEARKKEIEKLLAETEDHKKLLAEYDFLERRIESLHGYSWKKDMETMFQKFGFALEDLEKPIGEFSGGQQTKIALIQLLLQRPDILLLDEPTNHLDLNSITWLETYILNYPGAVLIVSHDRYFLNRIVTKVIEIENGELMTYSGNYTDYSQKKQQIREARIKEYLNQQQEIKHQEAVITKLRSFNRVKSIKRAESRVKMLDKIQRIEKPIEIDNQMRISLEPRFISGNDVLTVEGLSKTIDGEKILDNLTFTLGREDKVAFVGGNEFAKTILFKILIGEMEPDEGTYKWGVTTSQAYFPKDFGGEFDNDYNITEWLTQYSEEKDVTYVRGFLGRMLFSGEDGVKKVAVLSGGEKVRCLLSKMMISGANVLLLDEPTNHLDMESITALNNGLIKFPGVLLFTSRDHQIVQTTANRIMEIVPGGKLIDKITTYDEYLESDEMARKRQTYSVQTDDED